MRERLFLLALMSIEQLRALAERLRVELTDRRLGAPGVAAKLARKRSLALDTILAGMGHEQLVTAATRLGVSTEGDDERLRQGLSDALSTHTVAELRRAVAARPAELVSALGELQSVLDGDTVVVNLAGQKVVVRLRGVDAPERRDSDKSEADLDHGGLDRDAMFALGGAAHEWLSRRLVGRIKLELQLTPAGPHKYLVHRGHRLLAYLSLDGSDEDVGEALLREGFGLVWPRNVVTRRYLHPRSERYIDVCSRAREEQPGLWRKGLGALCPAHGARAWGLADCRRTCLLPPPRSNTGGDDS